MTPLACKRTVRSQSCLCTLAHRRQLQAAFMTMGKSCEVYGVLVTVYCCGMSLVGTESESTAGALECGPDSLDS